MISKQEIKDFFCDSLFTPIFIAVLAMLFGLSIGLYAKHADDEWQKGLEQKASQFLAKKRFTNIQITKFFGDESPVAGSGCFGKEFRFDATAIKDTIHYEIEMCCDGNIQECMITKQFVISWE